MPRVTVVVPTYNRRDCLIDTLRSALTQTFLDLELVVVDDGSTDDSAVEVLRHLGPDPERAESLWKQHKSTATGAIGFGFWISDIPLQYIYQPNRGMGAARNRGAQAAHGEFLAFLEPDYRWDSRHLERLLGFFDRKGDTWITHGRVVNGKPSAKSGKKTPAPSPLTFEEVVSGNELCASAMLVRQQCLEVHCGFDENLPACEDYDLWIRIAAHVPIYQVPDAIVRHMKKCPQPPSWSLNRYRVYALEKAYQSGHLNARQRHRVADELVTRCDILVEGFRKRNNMERANFYDRKRKKFELEVTKLDLSDAAGKSASSRDDASAIEEDSYSSPAHL